MNNDKIFNISIFNLVDRKLFICGRGSMGQQGTGDTNDCPNFHEILLNVIS